jgi:predicted transcriptional regulator
MAMNLRLDAAHEELLDALAAQERRTKTEIVKLAIEERAARADKSARTRAIFQRILDEDAALLEALSQ